MKISYNWLHEYLPERIERNKLSRVLTSIGLEVEAIEEFEQVKNSLEGLVIGEVLSCEKHPAADRLQVTTVNIGQSSPIQIVCGASNVSIGQKVVVALPGVTIYPISGTPISIKNAKIRGVESSGMICAEDEIGLGTGHEGILVLSPSAIPGTTATDYFKPFKDQVFEIGLTPNRMDAMSHLGVAKDVCAWLYHHEKKQAKLKLPDSIQNLDTGIESPIKISVENSLACPRYAGVVLHGVKVEPSPVWMQQYLVAVGQRPVNNVVDITNFILHETGQPLHAFDLDTISGGQVFVKCLPAGAGFITLDGQRRILASSDLMICDAEKPLCMAGVFGGIESGISDKTTNIFLESACFSSSHVRRTSLTHMLRTESAVRFEKGVDISQTVAVLKRAIHLFVTITGAHCHGNIIDHYPHPAEKNKVTLKYHFLSKISGKNYHPDAVKSILFNLGFELEKETIDEITLSVPYSKPDITVPADLAEEILRIDGLDNIGIPETIQLSPAGNVSKKEELQEKLSGALTGLGFCEIVCNSITNSKYYDEETLSTAVFMINSLSSELDLMRPSMLEPALSSIQYNLNRKNNDLRFFEFGHTYQKSENAYIEVPKLSVFMTGNQSGQHWTGKSQLVDIFYSKGIASFLTQLAGIKKVQFSEVETDTPNFNILANGELIGKCLQVPVSRLKIFDIEQTIFWIDFEWHFLIEAYEKSKIVYKPLGRFMAVQRDISMVVDKTLPYGRITEELDKLAVPGLQKTELFDIFQNEKLGDSKKSMAIRFTFENELKTQTEKEIESLMSGIRKMLEVTLEAEIRK